MNKIYWKITIILLKIYWPLQRMHQYFLSFKKDKNKIKIFCIGSPKTGTTSLNKALHILGYKSARLYDWPTLKKHGRKKYIDELKNSSYNAFVDFPMGLSDLYKSIDLSIPNSKFILTIRDIKSHKMSFYNFYKDSPFTDITKHFSENIDYIEKRNKEVLDYFKNKKSQLLIMNITEGDGWEKLCNFLNKPIPNKSFPHKNIGRYRKNKKVS